MIERKAVSVSLTPELHAFVNELVEAGGYANASEVVRAGLRLLQHEDAARRDLAAQGLGTERRRPVRDRRDARD